MEFQENNKAIYLQLADKICDDILQHTLPENERIPSVREFAAVVQVNANTVMRTYDHLQQSGIIYNKRGIGYFVSPEASDLIKKLRMDQFLNNDVNLIFRQLQLLGITPDELYHISSQYCNK